MQAYHSPLQIVPKAHRDQLDQLDLKMLRKELLLRLELSGNSTLEINGREYDRNGLLQAVEALKDNLPEHLRLFRNRPLLKFVEEGELSFLELPDAWEDLKDLHFQNWLRPYFTYQYSRVLYNWVSKRSYHSIRALRKLNRSEFRLPPDYRDTCHHKTFSYLNALLAEAWRQYPAPIRQEGRKKVIDSGVETYINLHLFNAFSVLDPDFQSVIYGFGRYCHEILAQAFPARTKLNTFSLPTLHILHNAAKIAVLTNDDPSLASINRTLNSYLSSYSSPEESSWPRWLKTSLLVLYLGFLFFSGIDSCSGPKTNSNLNIPDFPKIMERVAAPMTEPELLGLWQTPYLAIYGDTIFHQFLFFGDGTGQSIYFPQESTPEDTCSFHFNFNWKMQTINLGNMYYQTLDLEITRPESPAVCEPQKWPALARELYQELQERPDTLYKEMSFLFRKKRSWSQYPSISIVGESQIYQQLTSPQTPPPVESHPDSSSSGSGRILQ